MGYKGQGWLHPVVVMTWDQYTKDEDRMSDEFLHDRRQALEDSFFRKRDCELLQKLKEELAHELKRKELAAISGFTDVDLLDRLIRLDLGNNALAALSMVPLVRVAWADGRLLEKERDAILQAAVQSGISKSCPSYQCLLAWLEEKPDGELFQAWSDYVKALGETLSDTDRIALRDGLVAHARQVAEASGGFLGLGAISESEQAELDRIEAAFG